MKAFTKIKKTKGLRGTGKFMGGKKAATGARPRKITSRRQGMPGAPGGYTPSKQREKRLAKTPL